MPWYQSPKTGTEWQTNRASHGGKETEHEATAPHRIRKKPQADTVCISSQPLHGIIITHLTEKILGKYRKFDSIAFGAESEQSQNRVRTESEQSRNGLAREKPCTAQSHTGQVFGKCFWIFPHPVLDFYRDTQFFENDFLKMIPRLWFYALILSIKASCKTCEKLTFAA